MIRAIELRNRMQAQPVKPFRICLSNSKTYDITNHDMMFVKPNSVIIGINPDANSFGEYYVECAILHIADIEDILPAKAA
jgi:hypothetical protein